MKKQIMLMICAMMVICGCTMPIYRGGIEPIYPGVRMVGKTYETVDTLTPTFRWKSGAPSGSTYDFAIWDSGKTSVSGLNAFEVTKGPAVYYKEGLARPEHTVEIPLGPDSRYFWSVRIRSNGKVSGWAYYDYEQWTGVGSSSGRNWLYNFKTPKMDAK